MSPSLPTDGESKTVQDKYIHVKRARSIWMWHARAILNMYLELMLARQPLVRMRHKTAHNENRRNHTAAVERGILILSNNVGNLYRALRPTTVFVVQNENSWARPSFHRRHIGCALASFLRCVRSVAYLGSIFQEYLDSLPRTNIRDAGSDVTDRVTRTHKVLPR